MFLKIFTLFTLTLLGILFHLRMAIGITIIARSAWLANPPEAINSIPNNLTYVVIHHSETPLACYTARDCEEKMREMQRFHQDDRGWNDIGYHFAIGGDGNIYEGRGFNLEGAHAKGYNRIAYGICLIGNWNYTVPSRVMTNKVRKLISFGVKTGKIAKNYKLLGHHQVTDTDCLGNALFNMIKKWPHFSNKP